MEILLLSDYIEQSKAVGYWDPDPFQPHADGPWHERNFDIVVDGIASLLARCRAGEVSEHHLLRGKDNGPNKRDTLSYWLYYQHHPGSEKWKLMGQRYWSVDAWQSWRDAGGRAFPKRGRYGDRGLVSEHVVPKKKLKEKLKERLEAGDQLDRATIRRLLEQNLCCVVTRAEDRGLLRDEHRNVYDPWLRYTGTEPNIVLLHNPNWSTAETEILFQHGLLGPVSLRR